MKVEVDKDNVLRLSSLSDFTDIDSFNDLAIEFYVMGGGSPLGWHIYELECFEDDHVRFYIDDEAKEGVYLIQSHLDDWGFYTLLPHAKAFYMGNIDDLLENLKQKGYTTDLALVNVDSL